MNDLKELVQSISKRPGMYLSPPTVESFLSFVSGFDFARDQGALIGLKEWMVVKFKGGNNQSWEGFLNHLLRINKVKPENAIQEAAGILIEYIDYRIKHGIGHVMIKYFLWLQSQDWYDPEREFGIKEKLKMNRKKKKK